MLAVLISGLATRWLRICARRSLGEGSGLALATPLHLLDELLQIRDPALQRRVLPLLIRDPALLIRDPALLLRHLPAKLSILLKKFLVSGHVQTRLEHARRRVSSTYRRVRAGQMRGKGGIGAVNRYDMDSAIELVVGRM